MQKPYLTECPRDAIQGLKTFIPTEKKVAYLHYLLSLNLFDVLDFGSFVSPKAMPQMADTHDVVKQLEVADSTSKLLAIIGNERGASDAAAYEQISFLGYPFSISETFQLRNTNATVEESFKRVVAINQIAQKADKELVVYISMAFGNPYGDAWDEELVAQWLDKLKQEGVRRFALSDTIGSATPVSIEALCRQTLSSHPDLHIGVHLHTLPQEAEAKIAAAAKVGCHIFDGALMGYGGCPMAADTLTGNMPTEALLRYFQMGSEELIGEAIGAFSGLIST